MGELTSAKRLSKHCVRYNLGRRLDAGAEWLASSSTPDAPRPSHTNGGGFPDATTNAGGFPDTTASAGVRVFVSTQLGTNLTPDFYVRAATALRAMLHDKRAVAALSAVPWALKPQKALCGGIPSPFLEPF